MTAINTAMCLAVGSELLGRDNIDSNSLTITAALAAHGVEVVEKRVLGDDVERIASALRDAAAVVDLVVVTGGLGPTADDVTREAVARAFDRDLVPDPEIEDWIRQRFASFGRSMPDVNLKQALVVEGSTPLVNLRGTAPGIMLSAGGALILVCPGVPVEMEALLESALLPELERRNPGRARRERSLVLSGVGESDIEERVQHLYERFGRHNITILAGFGTIRFIFSASGAEERTDACLDDMEAAFRGVLGDDVAGPGSSLEEVLLQCLRQRGQTLATAESCTGGLIGAGLTAVPGSSDVYLGGVVSYSNEVKASLVDVPESLLTEHGAVSEAVARAMAEGARARIGTDWGVAVTGIAGPGGGSEEKPVGLVHWAVAGPHGVVARHRLFPGTRKIVRRLSVNSALDLVRRSLV